MFEYLLKSLSIMTLSSVMLLKAPALGLVYKLEYWECLIYTALGGIAGAYFFTMFAQRIMKIYSWIRHKFVRPKNRRYSKPMTDAEGKITVVYTYVSKDDLNKKRFNPSLRRFLVVWNKYGILGISLLTPLISMPVGCFIAARLEKDKGRLFLYLSLGVVFWSVILTSTLYRLIPGS